MANSGRDTNGSQFFLLYKSAPHLDGKHTVFGRVVGGLQVGIPSWTVMSFVFFMVRFKRACSGWFFRSIPPRFKLKGRATEQPQEHHLSGKHTRFGRVIDSPTAIVSPF